MSHQRRLAKALKASGSTSIPARCRSLRLTSVLAARSCAHHAALVCDQAMRKAPPDTSRPLKAPSPSRPALGTSLLQDGPRPTHLERAGSYRPDSNAMLPQPKEDTADTGHCVRSHR